MKLPTLLAGPILRRTEPKNVYIMTVTSEKFTSIRTKLFKVKRLKDGFKYISIKTRTVNQTVKLGKHIYVHLTKMVPPKGVFPVDELLCYNLHFIKQYVRMDLSHFGLLSKNHPNSILYGDLKYPSFYIKSTKGFAPIIYGSCRKLHGVGEDALAAGDQLMKGVFFNLEKRPQSLFLMGDQIYADDVADPIISFISKLGKELTDNRQENLLQVDPSIYETTIKEMEKIQGRKELVEEFAYFTSFFPHNHLIYLHEFLAMYLLSFSPDIWDIFIHMYQFKFNPNNYSAESVKVNSQKRQYENQLNEVKSYARSIAGVRRLLANTPTYMVFDDHDITDDWNISYRWKENVQRSPLGKLIVANGILSYWIFQGWGNDPDKFDRTFIQTVERYVSKFDVKDPSYIKWIEKMWNFSDWEFFAPTSPRAIFLDTRTKRRYEKNGGRKREEKLPRLINKDGWKNVKRTLINSEWKREDPLIIVSAYPLYGIHVIEDSVKNILFPLEKLGIPVRYSFDMEAWKYNEKGFKEFHKRLFDWGIRKAIILSGDAHYAFAYQTNIHLEKDQKLSIYQFTSSPLKNESLSKPEGFLLNSMLELNNRIENRRTYKSYEWKEEGSYLKSDGTSTIIIQNNLGYLKLLDGAVENYFIRKSNDELEWLESK